MLIQKGGSPLIWHGQRNCGPDSQRLTWAFSSKSCLSVKVCKTKQYRISTHWSKIFDFLNLLICYCNVKENCWSSIHYEFTFVVFNFQKKINNFLWFERKFNVKFRSVLCCLTNFKIEWVVLYSLCYCSNYIPKK